MWPGQACVALIKQFEQLTLRSHLRAGVWTIGWGHTEEVERGDIITPAVARDFLRHDLESIAIQVLVAVHPRLRQSQLDAICAWAFACRSWRTSRLIRFLNAGDMASAASEFALWGYAEGNGQPIEYKRFTAYGPIPWPNLVARRAAERKLFESE